MKKNDIFTKLLAIVGTVLAWFPVITPLVLSLVSMAEMGEFRLDYLMPAELFLVALAGAGLLLWSAFRAHARRKLIGFGLSLSVALLVGSQVLAVVTGLASGQTQTGGWEWAVVLGMLALFTLALIEIGVGGVLLVRDLFRSPGLLAADAA